jgi:signal transduction histidine kinase
MHPITYSPISLFISSSQANSSFIGLVGILIIILYLIARMLKPIFDLTQATAKIKKGNFDVTVTQKGTDELSILTQSFNSMTDSIRELIQNHCD